MMKHNEFDRIIKDRLYSLEEQAPNVLDVVFAKRTAWYIFRNKLIIERNKIIAAAAVLAVLLTSICLFINQKEEVDVAQNAQTESLLMSKEKAVTSSSDVYTNPLTTNRTSGDLPENDKSSTQNDRAGKTKINANNPKNNAVMRPEKENRIKSVFESNFNHETGDPGHGNSYSNSKLGERADDQPTDPIVESNKKTTNEIDEGNQNSLAADKPLEDSKTADNPEQGEILPDVYPIKRWSLSAAYGPTRAFRNLDGGNSNLSAVRNGSENRLPSQQASLLFNYELTPALELYSGLNWFNRRESMIYAYETTRQEMQVTSREVVIVHPVEPPKTVTVHDTTYQQVVDANEGNYTNKYSFVSIPVGARVSGYYGRSGRFGIHLNADATFRISTVTKGVVLQEDLSEQDLVNSEFSRKSLGFGVSTGIGMSYMFEPRITGLVDFRATRFITPTNDSRYGLNQYDYGYGFLFGLKYHF